MIGRNGQVAAQSGGHSPSRGVAKASPSARPVGIDLSRKTALIKRRLGSKAASAGVRTRTGRMLAMSWRFFGFVTSAALTAWLLAGRPAEQPAWFDLAAAFWLFVILAARLVQRSRRVEQGRALQGENELEQALDLGVLAVVGAYVLVAFSGGIDSPAGPAVYAVLAAVVVFNTPIVGVVAVALTLCLELALAFRLGYLHDQTVSVASRGFFIVLFAVLYHSMLSSTITALRRKTRKAIDSQMADLRRRAREYRLIVSSGGTDLEVQGGSGGREKWIAAAVEEIDSAIRAALEVVECALETHTVAIYLLSGDEKSLRLRECLSESDHVARFPLVAGEGLPGVVLHRREPVRLCGAFRGAIYYSGGPAPRSFLGVPLIERRPGGPADGELRGVLLADRLEDTPFNELDERLLTTVAAEILRRMELERVMGYIRQEKDEKVRFYRAIEALNLLSKPDEVCGAVVRLATELAPLDFVAITLLEGGEDDTDPLIHRIAEAVGSGSEALKLEAFEDNSGIVSNVVRLGSPLPGRDFHEMQRKVVFSEDLPVNGLSTLKVLPLLAGETVVGTLVCGSSSRGALVGDSIRKLSVLAMQAAGAIARARLFAKTEKMATTDGLTGLNNHRRFQECFEMATASSRRYKKSVSLLLADVDHFKGVNDTYGHPIGDLVLKGVAATLSSQARDTDIVARYGGEEFAIVLPETDAVGARVIAERIRRKVESEVFRTDVGPLRITLSIGVACFPTHGEHKQQLIEKADQALYQAKEAGRNRVMVA